MTFGNSTCVSAVAGVVCYGVFFNYRGAGANHAAVECNSDANFNSNISGIGIVVSFAFSAIITTLASIAASVLDHIASRRNSILPAKWQPQGISAPLRARCNFWRRVLERLIINFADQQLVTGFALLTATWVKLHENPVLTGTWVGWRLSHFPNFWLPNAQFSLVVFLCMASSSSHLSCVLVLREYMEDHRSAARLRLTLIVIFAVFLAVTIALASSLTAYFAFLIIWAFDITITHDKALPQAVEIGMLATCIAVPLMAILAICWLCILQSMPHLKEKMKEKTRSVVLSRLRRWFKLSTIWHRVIVRPLPQRWRKPCTQFVKRCFWLALVGNEFAAFVIQILLAVVSLVWIGLQRLATPPSYLSSLDEGMGLEYSSLCSLHGIAGDRAIASFGQLLPVILLLQPVLGAYGTYIEERDKQRVSGYAYIPEWEWSPSLPKRPSRKSTSRSEDETILLDSQSRRHESSGSVGSPFGRVHHGGHESQGSLNTVYGIGEIHPHVPAQTAYSPETIGGRNAGGYFGARPGYSTGYGDQQYASGRNGRW